MVQHWATKVPPLTGPGEFEVTQVDVDGDVQPAWLVARLQGMRSGLGVSAHSLCVVWPQQPTRAPLCRELSEWRRLSLPVQESGRAGCSLMDGAWRPGRETGRGTGTYAVGRLLPDFLAEHDRLPQSQAQSLWYPHATAAPEACPGPRCPH